MTNRLPLALSLLIALTPSTFAQTRVVADVRASGPAPVAGASANGLTAGPLALPTAVSPLSAAAPLVSPSLPALSTLEAAVARPQALAELSAEASPSAAFVSAVAAQPALLADPALRAAAVSAFGAETVTRVAAAAAAVNSAASTNKALATALNKLRRSEGDGIAATIHARAALERIARELGTMKRDDGSAVVVAVSGGGRSSFTLSRPSRLMRALRTAVFALSLASPVLHSAPTFAQVPPTVAAQAQAPLQDVLRARDVNDAISRWTPGTHLIVIGDPGLSRTSLNDLNKYLADKHWTVVLVGDASGMSYRDVDGNTRYDVDAVQFGLGQGLYKKQGDTYVNAQTGERDGSVFAITLSPKNLYLRNSDAQKARGLYGEDHYKGDLDQYAIAKMRSGGDVVGAVESTVENVDQRLNSAIAAESSSARTAIADAKTKVDDLAAQQSDFSKSHPAAAATLARSNVAELRRQLAAAEAEQSAGRNTKAASDASAVASKAAAALSALQSFNGSYASAQSALTGASSAVDALDKAAAGFRAEHPKSAGNLARPNVAQLRDQLKSASAKTETDPASAVASAASVTSSARAQADAIAQYGSGSAMFDEAGKRLAALDGNAYKSAATDSIVSARQSLTEARELWQNGDAGWAQQLDSAKTSIAAAEHATAAAADQAAADAAAAAAAARLHAILLWGFIALMSLLTGGAALFLNLRARKKAVEAQALYDTWETGLAAKSNANIDNLREKVQLYAAVSGQYARHWTGETDKVATEIRADSGRAILLLAKAKQIHAEANALLHPKAGSPGWFVNAFWPSRSEEAIRILQDEPVTFNPKEAAELFGVEKSWDKDLLGDIKSYQPFKKSFNEVIKEFNEKAAAAKTAVEKLEFAVTQSGKVIGGAETALKAAAERKASVVADDGLFAVPSLFDKALPAGVKLVDAARELVKTDPMAGVYGPAKEAERIASDATSLLDAIAGARAKSLAAAYASQKSLSERGVAASWITTDAKALSAAAESAAASVEKGSIAASVSALSSKLDDLNARASRAAEIARKIDEIVHDHADKAESAVVAARAEVGRVLGLDPERTLREEGNDPSVRIDTARRLAAEAKSSLAAGQLDAADGSGAKAAQNADEAAAIAAATLESLRTQERVSGDRRAETARLDEAVPQHAAVLKSIADQFAPSVMDLGSGDASHPNADGTVSNNIDEANEAIAAAKSKTERSAAEFKAGNVLKAASLLSQAKAHQEIAQHRLNEITEKRARLDKTVAANAANLTALQARVADYQTKVAGDKRSMKPTLEKFKAIAKTADGAATIVNTKKGDPFHAADALAAVSASLDSVWASARNDFDAYNHLQSVLQSAQSQINTTASLVRDAKGDGVADSPAITQAYRDHERLVQSLGRVQQSASADHADWPAIDREASGVITESSHVAATLKGEIAAAARATQAISSAAAEVSAATAWTGSRGVYIPGSPGSSELSYARAALNSGDYAGAIRYAQSASSAAAAAIAAAEAEVARLIRQEEEERRRQEEERRRREQEEEDRRRRAQEDEDRRRRAREDEDRRNSGGGSSGGWGGSSSGGGDGGSWGSSSSGGGSSSW